MPHHHVRIHSEQSGPLLPPLAYCCLIRPHWRLQAGHRPHYSTASSARIFTRARFRSERHASAPCAFGRPPLSAPCWPAAGPGWSRPGSGPGRPGPAPRAARGGPAPPRTPPERPRGGTRRPRGPHPQGPPGETPTQAPLRLSSNQGITQEALRQSTGGRNSFSRRGLRRRFLQYVN
jgi:hypothetical protein